MPTAALLRTELQYLELLKQHLETIPSHNRDETRTVEVAIGDSRAQ